MVVDNFDILESKIYSHYRNREWIADPYVGFRLDRIKKTLNNQIIVETNFLGLRSGDNFLKENYDTIYLGGSVIYGAFSTSNETTIPSFYEKISNQKTLNAGIGGHILNQHFSFYFNYLVKLHPKNLIIVFGFNDMSNCYNGKKYTEIKLDVLQQNYVLKKNLYKDSTKLFCKSIIDFLKLNIISSKIFKNNSQEKNKPKSKLESYLDDLFFVIELFNNLKINSNIYFFIQPNLITTNKKLSSYENNILSNIDPSKIEFCKYFHKKLSNKLISFENVINLENIFDNDEKTIFLDDVHINDLGNQKFAKKINKVINSAK
jgi:lysophospholipase L1-like esterase